MDGSLFLCTNMATTIQKVRLGEGGRFADLKRKVGSSALASWIGRKKYGEDKFPKKTTKKGKKK